MTEGTNGNNKTKLSIEGTLPLQGKNKKLIILFNIFFNFMLGRMLKRKWTPCLHIWVLVSMNMFRFNTLNQPDGQGG